jgi:Chain length determinant protein
MTIDQTPGGEETSELAQGIFEPPNSFIATAIGRHKLLVCAFAVMFAIIGFGIGLARQPVYTASASVQVGQVNPNSPGFLGYTQSASSLATVFSRSIVAAPVLTAIQRKLNLSRSTTLSRLSAEPIPLAPVFRVIATGPSESKATGLANAAAGAVIAYIGKSNSANPAAGALLDEYRHASLAARRAKTTLDELNQQGSPPPDALLTAEAAKSAAKVRLEAIGRSYISTVASQAPRSGLVTLAAGATSASSDRRSKVEQYAFIGLLVGLVIGCAAAVARERRRRRPAAG